MNGHLTCFRLPFSKSRIAACHHGTLPTILLPQAQRWRFHATGCGEPATRRRIGGPPGRAEAERAAAAAADAVRQELACGDCGQQRVAGLCEACGYRRRTEVLVVEAGLVAATWAADLTDAADVTGHVRRLLAADIAKAQGDFMALVEPGELDADPAGAASVLAFAGLQAVEAALPEYRSSALGRLGRTGEAETEARRAYRTEQGRRWFRRNPNGADAVAAATKAADAARERTAQYLLSVRLEQLRGQAAARTEQAGSAPWTDRLPGLAARPLDDDATGTVIA